MLENEIKLLNNAYENYNTEIAENIPKMLLEYIEERLIANKEGIKEISKMFSDASYESIMDLFIKCVKEKDIYKKEKTLKKLNNGFAYGIYTTSIGNVLVETSETLDVLKYFVYAIKSRNTITISDIEYLDHDLKHIILLIFTEALEKFNIDKNLLMIIPYKRYDYKIFDKVILRHEKKIIEKENTNKLYIYLEDDKFTKEVELEKEYLKKYSKEFIVLSGNMNEVINQINREICLGASIYTSNPQKAYQFVNLVHAKNVFVNTSFAEIDTNIISKEELYMKKKVMYPMTNN